jgi:hypothetical protein
MRGNRAHRLAQKLISFSPRRNHHYERYRGRTNNFNSWNRHDADAINAAYAKGGTYRTPRMGQALTGSAADDWKIRMKYTN